MLAAPSRATRHAVDTLVLFVAVVLIGITIWPSGMTASTNAAVDLGNAQYAYIARFAAGALAVAAIIIAQKWKRVPLARAMLFVCATLLAVGWFISRPDTPRALLMLAIPALVFLVAAFLVGPMPPPNRNTPEGSGT